MDKEELNALPVGSVVMDHDCDLWVKTVPSELPGPYWSEVEMEVYTDDHYIDERCILVSRPLPRDLEQQIADYLLVVGAVTEDSAPVMAANLMSIIGGRPSTVALLAAMTKTRNERNEMSGGEA